MPSVRRQRCVGGRAVPADRGHRLDLEPERARTSGSPTCRPTASRSPTAVAGRRRGVRTSASGTVDFAVTRDPVPGPGPADRAVRHAERARRSPTCRWSPVARRSCTTWRSAASSTPGCGCRGRRSRRSSPGRSPTGTTRQITADNNGLQAAGHEDHPGGPLGRLRHDRAVHHLDGQPVPVAVAAVLPAAQGLTSYYPIKARDGRQGRLGRRRRPHRGQLRQRHDRLRRVLVRAERQLPGGEGAQQGRATTSSRRPTTSRSR